MVSFYFLGGHFMVKIKVYSVDSLSKPGQIRQVIREFEDEARLIPTEITKPIFIGWRAEERARNGELLNFFVTFGKFNDEYVGNILKTFVDDESGYVDLITHTEIAGSDPMFKIASSKASISSGVWRLTHLALINPYIPLKEREIGYPFQETIKHVPEYVFQRGTYGFFNGSFTELAHTPEKLPEKALRNKGIQLLLDVIGQPELQLSFFEDLQIPLISTFDRDYVDLYEIWKESVKTHRRFRNWVEKQLEKHPDKVPSLLTEVLDKGSLKHLDKMGVSQDIIKALNNPKHELTLEEFVELLSPRQQNQIVEYLHLRDETKFDSRSKTAKLVNKESIMEIPCVIYSLQQCGVSEEILEEIKQSNKIYGSAIKMKPLVEILSKHHIQLIVHRLKKCKKQVEGRITDVKKYPRSINGMWTTIEVDQFENHMFIRKSYYSPRAKKEVSALLALIYGFKYGLLRRFNAYEFYKWYHNYSLDPMIKFDLARFWEEVNPAKFSPTFRRLNKPRPKPIPDAVYYADFESTTNEDRHIPYMVHCIGPNLDQTFVGEDCAYQLLAAINSITGLVPKKDPKTGEEKMAPPLVRLYFHNLKYDYTFIRGYLRDIEECTKGAVLYSALGNFTSGNPPKKSRFDFWDTLPIMRCKLSKAAENYIGGERAKEFQKEACPYAFYTRDNFKLYENGWVSRSIFESGFGSEKEIAIFREILPKLDESIYNKETDEIEYMKYSAFYCRQDVVIMKEAFENIRELFLGEKEIPGIHGKPPFKLDIFKYRTISSIAWAHFIEAAYGNTFKGAPDPACPGKTLKENHCPAFEFSEILRILGRLTVRGGRNMNADNEPHYYCSPDWNNSEYDLVDYDAVSLYPSAGARAWVPKGIPILIKPPQGQVWTQKEFLEWFDTPETKEKTKIYSDGWLYVTKLHVKKPRSFPLLCIKNKEGLNNYENFNNASVQTMVSMIDLFNFIDFQDGEFEWQGGIVWEDGRDYSCQNVFQELNEFRKKNHNLKDEQGNPIPDHPIANLSKLVSNSIYGKTNQKIQNFETLIIDTIGWRKDNVVTKTFSETNQWQEFFNANAYRMIDFEPLAGNKDHIKVRVYKTDKSFALIPLAVNILAMSKRIIGPVIMLGEEVADELKTPRPFYTDTDSVHIVRKTLPLLKERFEARFGYPLDGPNLGQFHIDFDAPENFLKEDKEKGIPKEKVRGAVEAYFCAKKVYADRLVGDRGSIGFHMRMKGIVSSLVKWEDYVKFFNNEPVTYELALGKLLFEYENGQVCTKTSMIRTVMSRECRRRLKEAEKSKKRPREEASEEPLIEIIDESTEPDVVIEDNIEVATKRQKI